MVAAEPTTERKLRVALIGLRHGRSHAKVLQNHSRAVLTAMVDLDRDTLDRSRAQFGGGVAGFTQVEELIRAEIADAVVIAVPTSVHTPMALACWKAGLHILLEKPLCRTDDEAESLRTAIAGSDQVFQVGYEVRSSPLHRSIMQHIQRGDLGEVTNVWWHQHTNQLGPGYRGWRASRANMGGALFDCSPHFLDLIGQWAGSPLLRVVALGNVRGATGVCDPDVLPESAAIALEYANGIRGTFNFGGVNSFGDDATFGVAGTTGCIRGNPNFAGSYELRSQSGVVVSQVTFDPKLTSAGHLGFDEQWEFFLDTVFHGAPNVCPFEDALTVHRMMRAIDRSLGSGKVEELDPLPIAVSRGMVTSLHRSNKI